VRSKLWKRALELRTNLIFANSEVIWRQGLQKSILQVLSPAGEVFQGQPGRNAGYRQHDPDSNAVSKWNPLPRLLEASMIGAEGEKPHEP
jgi:hypothetical protein